MKTETQILSPSMSGVRRCVPRSRLLFFANRSPRSFNISSCGSQPRGQMTRRAFTLLQSRRECAKNQSQAPVTNTKTLFYLIFSLNNLNCISHRFSVFHCYSVLVAELGGWSPHHPPERVSRAPPAHLPDSGIFVFVERTYVAHYTHRRAHETKTTESSVRRRKLKLSPHPRSEDFPLSVTCGVEMRAI